MIKSEACLPKACLLDAFAKVSDYIANTTGTAATQEEMADALGRYFVLQEIKEHIEMRRDGYMEDE